jgi:hypothetical protein
MNKWLVTITGMAVAGAALAATSVESANVVGYDKSFEAGDGSNFACAPFLAVGYNTVDIQSIQIPGAEWDGVTFAIWEGLPTSRDGSEFTYYAADNDPNGEATQAYWGDDEANPAAYSIEGGQSFTLDNVSGYTIQYAGQVPDEDVTITAADGSNFFGNPFPTAIDIQSIQIPGAEWDGVTFAIWEGLPTSREGSEFTYYAADNDPNGEATEAYWGDDEANPVSYSIAVGQGFVLDNVSGYDVSIAKPYTL